MLLVTLVFSSPFIILILGLSYLFLLKRLNHCQVLSSIILLVVILFWAPLFLDHWWPGFLETLWAGCSTPVTGLSPGLSAIARQATGRQRHHRVQRGNQGYREAPLEPGTRLVGRFSGAPVQHVQSLCHFPGFSLSNHVSGAGCRILDGSPFCHRLSHPQGIGVVEGVMPAVFRSLRVRGRMAIFSSLTFRGLTFWTPLAIGFFLLRYIRSFRSRKC